MTLPLFKALEEWPRPESRPTRSPFDASMTSTEETLNRELRAVRARYPVLSLVADESAVRLDGHLRSNAKIRHRGVILAFDQPGVGQVSYACDRFTATWRGSSLVDWQHNLRAIALGMEALRKVERYGIADAGQQYAGFRAIGAGEPLAMGAGTMTVDQAAALIADLSDDPHLGAFEVLQTWAEIGDRLYRQIARRLHPDSGGDPEMFRRLTEARDLLGGAS